VQQQQSVNSDEIQMFISQIQADHQQSLELKLKEILQLRQDLLKA